MRIRCADHVTPLYPQKLALTSPTGGGRSVGIVRSRTKATELLYLVNGNAVFSDIFRQDGLSVLLFSHCRWIITQLGKAVDQISDVRWS